MKQITKLTAEDILPLTCSRAGTCCFGNQVLLNPWELMNLASAKKISVREFRDLYCDYGGIRLRFNSEIMKNGKRSCNQYIDHFGCSVHTGRPLACRLYPLGRQIQNDEVGYMFEGIDFPCFEGCIEVKELPTLSVKEYLAGQMTNNFEIAQDAYLDMMQNVADIAFTLLLDT